MSANKKNEALRYFSTGLAHQQAGRLAEARQAYERGLKCDPGNSDALFLLGQVLFDSGDVLPGERKMRAALSARPQAANYRAGLAISLFNAGRLADAAPELALAVRSMPDDPVLWRGLAISSLKAGDSATAQDALAHWLRLAPDDAEAMKLRDSAAAQRHFGNGARLAGEGRYEAAIAEYEAALQLDPEAPSILGNLANVHAQIGNLERAQRLYEKAIACDPKDATAHFNLGILHLDAGRRLDAAIALERAAERDPANGLIAAHLLFQKLHLCRWDGLDELCQRVQAAILENTADIPPFIVLSMPGTTPQLQRRCADNHSGWLHAEVDAAKNPTHARHDRLRIGYLSSDFKNHATAFLMIEMLEAHDRSCFEVYGVSYGVDDRSAMRARVAASVEHFVDLAGLSGRDAAKRVADLQLDVLIDLKGYTEGNRSEWLQYRLAPVQINWLGYPGTLGAPWVDYLIADAVVAPMENQWMFSERLLHLPGCYQPNSRSRECGPSTTRLEEGLPDEAVVLCSFNQTYKVTPELFAVWLDILREVPEAVLWLWASNPWAESALRAEAEAAGVDPARLVFAEGRPQAAHLARLPLADLALDTFPCNGHTTTSDALWAGVPVVTLQGDAFAARVAGSLLVESGLPECVVTTADDYRRFVIDFCRDEVLRASLKARCGRLRAESALFDAETFARKFEALLTQVASAA